MKIYIHDMKVIKESIDQNNMGIKKANFFVKFKQILINKWTGINHNEKDKLLFRRGDPLFALLILGNICQKQTKILTNRKITTEENLI